ncbi:DUF3265 domain-containing protein [Vibrio alginolyticus]|nr:DUF3265 domain-containing protein [Vibrio alginolyticus]
MTKHLRVIPNAWHLRFTSALVFTVAWLSFVVALLTP